MPAHAIMRQILSMSGNEPIGIAFRPGDKRRLAFKLCCRKRREDAASSRCVFPGPLIFSGRLCPRCRSDWLDCSRRAQRQRELACSASCCCPLSSKSSQSRWCWCSIQQKRRHWRILHRRSRRLEQEQVKSCQARQPGLSRYVSSGASVWSRPMPALGGSSPRNRAYARSLPV